MPAPPRPPAARRLHLLALLLFWCAGDAAVALPQNATTPGGVSFEIKPASAWVKPFTAEPVSTLEPDEGGVAYLLIDRQENLETQEYFYHAVQQISSDKGVQNGSAITATFDPAYQTLTFHTIRVRRNGTALERLERSRIQLFQREKEMESSLYDGTYTARCELEDVRVGDLVEFAYTVRGVNPVMRGKYASTYSTTWSTPARRALIRLLYPASRKLHFRPRNHPIAPVESTSGRMKEWLLDQTNIPGRRVESDSPPDHEPRGSVQISEFADWADVVNWAVPLFAPTGSGTPELEAEAERLLKIADPEERILAALKFTQEEIRYVGIESGIGSHQPAAPHEVLRRRFGDCKDKSVLLVWLLQRVGIDAAAALVSSGYRSTVPERLPSPYVFDHAIVQVQHGGSTHWLDPTRNGQRGPLAQIYVTDFRHALPVRRGLTDLMPLTPPPASLPRRKIVDTYRIPAPEGTAELDVVTEYHGVAADRMRTWLRDEGREQVQKNYLQFYARRFPAIESREPLRFEEMPDANACRLSEFYSIPHVWTRDEKSGRFQLDLWPDGVDQVLGSVVSTRRDDPLSLDHPVFVTHDIHAEMFEPWNVTVTQREIANEFFRYREGGKARGRHLHFTFALEGRVDRVPIADLQKYNAAVREVREKLTYSLTYSAQSAVAAGLQRFNWLVAIPFVLLLGTGMLVALCYFFLSRLRSPLPPPLPHAGSTLEGIGGWLIVVAIGMLARPLLQIALFVQLIPTVFDLETWRTLTTLGAAAYHPLWRPALLFELFFNGALFIFNLLLVALFFCKRAAWPRLFILFLVINAAGIAIDFYLSQQIPAAAAEPGATRELFRALFAAAIWIPYCLKSERVRATFRS